MVTANHNINLIKFENSNILTVVLCNNNTNFYINVYLYNIKTID